MRRVSIVGLLRAIQPFANLVHPVYTSVNWGCAASVLVVSREISRKIRESFWKHKSHCDKGLGILPTRSFRKTPISPSSRTASAFPVLGTQSMRGGFRSSRSALTHGLKHFFEKWRSKMKNLLTRFLRDDAGFVISSELVLVATILVIGMIAGSARPCETVLYRNWVTLAVLPSVAVSQIVRLQRCRLGTTSAYCRQCVC